MLRQLQRQSDTRTARWHDETVPWTGLEWAGAMCGEAGEAANFAKKLRRLEQGMLNPKGEARGDLLEGLRAELADTIIYAAALANHYEIDLETAVIETFNSKSIECGFPERLTAHP